MIFPAALSAQIAEPIISLKSDNTRSYFCPYRDVLDNDFPAGPCVVKLFAGGDRLPIPPSGPGEYCSSRKLRGAIKDGTHYGDRDLTADTPIPDANFTSEPSIKIYPNPINNKPILEVSGQSEEFEIQIFDLLGRNLGVFARGVFDELASQRVHIDASQLARGSYLAVLVYHSRIQAGALMMK